LEWVNSGKPRLGDLFDDMRCTRKQFTNAFDYCRRNELRLRKERLASTFNYKNKQGFWKDIKKLNKNNSKAPCCIDDKTNLIDIVHIFDEKYKSIFDDIQSQTIPDDYQDKINKLNNKEQLGSCTIFKHTVDSAINSLKIGLGWDCVHANHLKYSTDIFRTLLCKLFSCFIGHSHTPKWLLRGEIRPTIKSASCDKSISNSYRPIMNSSTFLKVFEYSVLPYLKRYLMISKRQFGYRSNVGCVTATTVLKETILKYNMANCNVHCCFVDYSKAFDKLNINVLVSKLIDTDLPPLIVCIMKQMYENTTIGVRFGSCSSYSNWKVGNGTRQGGIWSGLIFSFYINAIIESIASCSVGCKIGFYSVNVLAYADDLVVVCPSANGLQFLIDKLAKMSHKVNLTINTDKTSYMMFKRNNYKDGGCDMMLDGNSIRQVQFFKYLGVIFNENLTLDNDVEKCYKSFLCQFNSIYHKFNFVDKEHLIFLFNSCCTSFYGCETWYDGLAKPKVLYGISVAYHAAVKRVVGLSKWHNNHDACIDAKLPIFKHFISSRIVSHLFSLSFSDSPCLVDLKNYFKNYSELFLNVKSHFLTKYGVDDIFNNCLAALKARINYVQRNEESSHFIPLFLNP
jgi:hypothetical protein